MSPDVALMWLSVASAIYKRSLGRNVVVLESTGCAEGCWELDFDLEGNSAPDLYSICSGQICN